MSQLVCMCTFDVDFILFPLPTKTTPTPYNHHLFYVESLMGALPLTVVAHSSSVNLFLVGLLRITSKIRSRPVTVPNDRSRPMETTTMTVPNVPVPWLTQTNVSVPKEKGEATQEVTMRFLLSCEQDFFFVALLFLFDKMSVLCTLLQGGGGWACHVH
jgi:hypothetical protein